MRFVFSILLAISLHISVIFSQAFSNAIVRTYEGVPALFVDDQLYPPFAYTSYLGEIKYYKEIAATGIHLYTIPSYLGDRGINTHSGIGPFRKSIWVGEKKYDFSSIEEDFKKVLAADANAKLIIRLHLDPPAWWEKKYSRFACKLPDGTTYRQSFFSDGWRQHTAKALIAVIQWLQNSAYAKSLIGIHIAAGGTEEWVYHYDEYFYDENPARKRKFRQWLKEKYQRDHNKLRAAWHQPKIKFGTALPADISGQDREDQWLDPQNDQYTIDTYRFHAETLADDIAYFCAVVKQASNRKLLTGAFYGYHYFIGEPRKGHRALSRLLRCPDLDYISSPNDYNRVAGEDWPALLAIQSVQMHGKLWLCENDPRTSITTLLKNQAPHINPPGNYYDAGVWKGPSSMDVSESFLWKNLGRMLSQGYGGWWFDMWGGWFSDPRLLTVFRSGQHFFSVYPSHPETKMLPEVAVVVDEELCFRDKSLGKLSNAILSNRYALGKTGAPYDLFLQTDISSIDLSRYKIIWLMGVDITQKKLQHFAETAKLLGKTIVSATTVDTEIPGSTDTSEKYAGKLSWKAAELRLLYKKAGVHIYISSDDVLYIGRRWLTLHSAKGGKKNIKFPFKATVTDPLSGAVLAKSVDTFDIELAPSSTRLLYIVPE